MTIQCVTLRTNNLFPGNPISEQHRLRYRSISKRQDWATPEVNDMEYDQYDNPATTYFISMAKTGRAQGVVRLNPTDRPFMLIDHFEDLVDGSIPRGPGIVEGSRFCIDNNLNSVTREKIAQELVISSLEYALDHGIKKIVGIMYPLYWRNLFTKNGWDPEWLGMVQKTPDGKKSRVASLSVNKEVLARVRSVTNQYAPITNYGMDYAVNEKVAA